MAALSNPKGLSSSVVTEHEMTFVFEESGSIEEPKAKMSTSWYYPEAKAFVCKMCGKRCKELGKPMCYRVNPYCG